MSEGSLSDKESVILKGWSYPNKGNKNILFYYSEDVKEFIKRLKEEVLDWNMGGEFKGFIMTSHVAQMIDKLAGEKLVNEEKE